MITHILNDPATSILIIQDRDKKGIVIGAPHHTVGGVKHMPCAEHTDGDENTGFIASEIALSLNIPSIIACNYTIDPNKSLTTDYAVQIAKWKPKYLIEIHGHGAKKVSDETIEISCGSIGRNKQSIDFSALLQDKLAKSDIADLHKYTVAGDFLKLHFQAAKSKTITDDRWILFHIELPPSLRIDANNKLPIYANEFISFLIETIEESCL